MTVARISRPGSRVTKGKATEANPPNGWHYNLTDDVKHEQK